jgi:UDP-N-acetylglucosamine 1-carboxyvinyltransferase
MGVQFREEQNYESIYANHYGLIPATHDARFSVGTTENILLTASLIKGQTVILNPATEPEIVDLVYSLQKRGVYAEFKNSNKLIIRGTAKPKGVRHHIIPDRIEIGTYLCAAAACGGSIEITHTCPNHLQALLDVLKNCNVKIRVKKDRIYLQADKRLSPYQLSTAPYPGFPTDMQSPIAAVLAKAKGESKIIDTIYQERFKYKDYLNAMGAKILPLKIDKSKNKGIAIHGKANLSGNQLACTDLRAGAAVIIAALGAKGTSEITHTEHVKRGYDSIELKLRSLGADIRVN